MPKKFCNIGPWPPVQQPGWRERLVQTWTDSRRRSRCSGANRLEIRQIGAGPGGHHSQACPSTWQGTSGCTCTEQAWLSSAAPSSPSSCKYTSRTRAAALHCCRARRACCATRAWTQPAGTTASTARPSRRFHWAGKLLAWFRMLALTRGQTLQCRVQELLEGRPPYCSSWIFCLIRGGLGRFRDWSVY